MMNQSILDKLIRRPIATTLCIIAIAVVCLLSMRDIPVSLMPPIDIPRVTVHVPMPGASVREAEDKAAAPLRGQLMQVAGLKDLHSEAKTDGATITLEFTPGSRMDLSFIEVNEKIDRAMAFLPEGTERPKVVKAGATDIPAFYLDIYLKNDSRDGFLRLTDYVTGVVRKRIEQLPQTAMVDISGDTGTEIIIEPDKSKTEPIGLTPEKISAAVSASDLRLEALSITDGAYRYSLHFDSQISTAEDIRDIIIRHDGRLLRLGDLCTVTERQKKETGLVRHNGHRAISLAIIKQTDARMEDLKESINALLDDLRQENPNVEFTLTRDQTQLLAYSIDNLSWNLALGIALACLVLFAFMRSVKAPMLIIVSIPLSLMVTMLCFRLIGISINIVSLAGLILGVGMMVDNSIIAIDNITRLIHEGTPTDRAVAQGATEVFTPMLSSVLTTCSVFIPLIFLSGTAGALFYDQAMAVTISLFSSLAVAMLVIPVYYRVMFRKGKKAQRYTDSTLLMKWYNAIMKAVMNQRCATITLLIIILAIGTWSGLHLGKQRMPDVTHTDMLINVDWNNGISLEKNDERMENLRKHISPMTATTTTMAGAQGFILTHTKDLTTSESVIYASAWSNAGVDSIRAAVTDYLGRNYPDANVEFTVSGNVYDMIFSPDAPDLEIRLQTATGNLPEVNVSRAMTDSINSRFGNCGIQPVPTDETLSYVADTELMGLYGITYRQIYDRLSSLTGSNKVYSLNNGTHTIPVIIGADKAERYALLSESIRTSDGIDVPLSILLKETRTEDYKRLHASSSGAYYPIALYTDDRTAEQATDYMKSIAINPDSGVTASYAGEYYESRNLLSELFTILIVAVTLLYLILAAQFESLLQPLIILSEVLIDTACVFIALWIIGESLNLMSMTGIVVMCGIIINDSILKIDTINRLRRTGMDIDTAIFTAGHQRLKPIIMTSLTTILAIVPFLKRGDMGSDLQFPLSYTIIVGMTAGTLVSLFVIPLLYKMCYKSRAYSMLQKKQN